MIGETLDKYFDFLSAYGDLETCYENLGSMDLSTIEEELFTSFLNRNPHKELALDLTECFIDLKNKRVTFFFSDIEEVSIEDAKTVCIGYNYIDEEIDLFEED